VIYKIIALFHPDQHISTATAQPMAWVWDGATCLTDQWQFENCLKTLIIFIFSLCFLCWNRNDKLQL